MQGEKSLGSTKLCRRTARGTHGPPRPQTKGTQPAQVWYTPADHKRCTHQHWKNHRSRHQESIRGSQPLPPTKTIQGIGEHMDKERNMVIGLCLGTKDRNICFQAYQGAMPIGPKLKLCLHPGDLYLMDINASTGSIMKPHVKHHATGGTGSENT